MTGIFASSSASSTVENGGLIDGSVSLFGVQVVSVLVAIAVAVVMTILILSVLKLTGNLRVTDLEEAQGLDLIEHGEHAYPSFNGLD